ncbi:DUF3611 family protein [Burkholderia sp. Bp9125]|nr:DUF3611 family protein [Burkholderia sp. Bp9125]
MLAAIVANYAFSGAERSTASHAGTTLSFIYLCVLAMGLSAYWAWRTVKAAKQRRRNKNNS